VFTVMFTAMMLCAAEEAPPRATITIDPQRGLGKVNPLIFGSNLLAYQRHGPEYQDRGAGIWDPVARRPVPEMLAFARDIRMTTTRWPGGCETHNYDWRKTVGPLDQRPKQQFGLPEFLRFSHEIGAVPVLTVADYFGDESFAADLVEYCNAPNDGANPNGGTDYAKIRAADGHSEPWNVVWFEYGNETDHGNHQGKVFSAEEYARRYMKYQAAMKAVDPRIKLGAVFFNSRPDPRGELPNWTRTVLQVAGKQIDFAIHHAYVPGYYKNDDPPSIARDLFAACLASHDQWVWHYQKLAEQMTQITGRRDIPLAITEFNGHFVQEKPVPYRHCLGNALVNAELLRVLVRPDLAFACAHYWEFANEYWGMVKGYQPPYVFRPNYQPFLLYARHFGDTLVQADVQCPAYDTDGGWGVQPARGAAAEFRVEPDDLLPVGDWTISPVNGVEQSQRDGVLSVEIKTDERLNYYHAKRTMPAQPRCGYLVTAEVRTEGLKGERRAQIQVGDSRGWLATQSASLSDQTRSEQWTALEASYVTLADAKAIEIVARRLECSGTGRLWFRNVRVRRFTPKNFGSVPYLGVVASRDSRTGRIAVMITNRHLDSPMRTTIRVPGAKLAEAWSMVGPAIDATNEDKPDTVRIEPTPVQVTDGEVRLTLPKHSFTAVVVR